MRIPLALFAALLLLSVGPGATASTSTPPRNGLIAVNGPEGISIVDPVAGTTKLVPKTAGMTDQTWSPDGTMLAVSSPTDAGFDVFTMKPDGSERKLVLENADSPSWSPDGKQLVVVREGKTEGDADGTELAIVDADGSSVRTLDLGPETPLLIGPPEWSPDGKLIAFADVGKETIEFVSPDGKPASTPVEAADAVGLSWSPDSTRLAFDRYVETKDGGRSVAVVLDVATGREAVYTGEQHGAQSPAWSPEGDQLAFLSMSKRSTSTSTTAHSCGGEPFFSHLWAMSAEGTKAHKLVEGEFYGPPSWARSLEAEQAPPTDTEPEQQPLPAPPADTAPEPLPLPAPASREDSTPDVAKPVNAKRLAVSAETDGLIAVRGSVALYLADPDGTTRKIPDTSDMVAPAWSPDAKLLAVERVGEDGSSSIWTIGPDGTDPRLVLKNATSPSWSAAGDLIYAVRNECAVPCEPEDEEANVLYSVRPDGTGAQRVDLEEADVPSRELEWPPDGSVIGFFDDASSSDPGSFDSSAAAWSSDWSQLAFIGTLGPSGEESAATEVTGLWIVSADGAPQLLLKGASGRPSWSPR